MPTRPTQDISWGTTGLKTEPAAPKKAEGYLAGKKLPARWLNWWKNAAAEWIAWLTDERDELSNGLSRVLTRNWVTGEAVADTSTSWSETCYSPELRLFVAVSSAGTSRVRYSSDGRLWNIASASAASQWTSVCWASGLGLFVAVANSAPNAGSYVMTSPDGVNWTSRNSAWVDEAYRSVCWSEELGLLVLVCSSGTNRVKTSPDGINWTNRTAAEANAWRSVVWGAEAGLFLAVAETGTNRGMYSADGTSWTSVDIGANSWVRACWHAKQKRFFICDDASRLSYCAENSATSWTALGVQSSGFATNGLLAFGDTLIMYGTKSDVTSLAYLGTDYIGSKFESALWTANTSSAGRLWALAASEDLKIVAGFGDNSSGDPYAVRTL